MIECAFEDGGKGHLRHVTIDALVTDGNKILLVKRAQRLTNGGKYAVPGGFLGRDENIKTAVAREALEETGYKIEIGLLFAITDKPNRKNEDRQNVNFTFLAKPIEKVEDSDDEVSEIHWFNLDDLPDEEEFAFDHYNRILLYKKYLQNKLDLPIIES